MKKYRFWFDEFNYGVSFGNNVLEAFLFFLSRGFVYDDVIQIDVEDITSSERMF